MSGSNTRPVPAVPPLAALEQFNSMLSDVDNLLARHSRADGGSGAPSTDEAPLLRSSMLLLYAAFETYVEESLIDVAEWTARRPLDQLPVATRAYVAKQVRDPWLLVERGWDTLLVELVTDELRGPEDHPSKFGLTSATPAQIQAVQKTILGEAPFDAVSWHNSSNRQVRAKLTRFVRIRGEIAHTGTTRDRLWMQDVRVWREFIPKLVGDLDYRLRMWMTVQSDGESDWWRAIEEHLVGGRSRSVTELRRVCDVETPQAGGDRAIYESFLAFLERRAAGGVLHKSGTARSATYRLASESGADPSLFDLEPS